MLWSLKEKSPLEFKSQFPELAPFVADLLWQRGLRDQTSIDEFFNPDYETDLHDPYLMPNMEAAVKRIVQAIEKKEKIGIFGDYDVDGVSGTVILVTILKKYGLEPMVYLPDRATEGYGLNEKAVQEMKQWGADLILTVDCGMSDFEEAELVQSLAMDLIIIDHHQPLEQLPQALAIVNPHLHDSQYPFKQLAATGVVFKLASALIYEIKQVCPELVEGFPSSWEKWLLDLVALATVADSEPLQGENRALVHYGLLVLAQTRRPGLKALMEVAGVKPVLKMQSSSVEESDLASAVERRKRQRSQTNLNPQTIAFNLAPRLNAASRMDHANSAYQLLMTEDAGEAEKLAKLLDEKNRERFQVVKKIIEEIGQKELQDNPVIFEGGKDWPIGVLGIVAGKIVDEFQRPVFVYQDSDGESMGSARSVNGFNLVEAMESCKQYLKEFGGHKAAAGFKFDSKNAEDLKKCLIGGYERLNGNMVEITEPKLEIDLEIEPKDFSVQFYESLRQMEPFGIDNPVPKLLLRGLTVGQRKQVGKDSQHSKMVLETELANGAVKEIPALAFNQILPAHLRGGEKVDVVGEMMPDEYNGSLQLSLKILDIRPSEPIQ